MLALQTFVRDIGRGLVMVGGPDSYGAGGYTKTPLEESLPVDMGVRDRQKEPDIALVVVIDQSGSMDACHCNSFQGGMGGPQIAGVKKVDIGKEAILRAVSAMSPRDQLGVVGFNESAHWAIHTAPLGTEGDIASQIAGIQPGGQTNIFAGLDEAVKSLEGTTAARRHIILFTDGWSTNGAYDQIIARMKAAGITLSTIGAGGGSAPVLAQLAQKGGGRYYPAPDPASIPDIFLKETQQVAGQQIVEESFHPIQTSDSPILRGITTGFPSLLGYNGTTAKSAAQTVLVTARDDPLLAQWQYGLGRSVAWTSDTTGHWAKDWVGWQGFSRFFSQLVSWTFPGEETGGIEARFDTQGGKTTLHVESVGADGSPRDFYSTTATIVGPTLTLGPGDAAPGRAGRLRDDARRDRSGGVRDPAHPDEARARRRSAGRSGSSRRRPPSTGRSGRTSRCSRRSGRRPAAGSPTTRSRSGSTTSPRPRRSPTCGRPCSSWRCSCGRSTSPSGGSRSGGANWPAARGLGPRPADPSPDARRRGRPTWRSSSRRGSGRRGCARRCASRRTVGRPPPRRRSQGRHAALRPGPRRVPHPPPLHPRLAPTLLPSDRVLPRPPGRRPAAPTLPTTRWPGCARRSGGAASAERAPRLLVDGGRISRFRRARRRRPRRPSRRATGRTASRSPRRRARPGRSARAPCRAAPAGRLATPVLLRCRSGSHASMLPARAAWLGDRPGDELLLEGVDHVAPPGPLRPRPGHARGPPRARRRVTVSQNATSRSKSPDERSSIARGEVVEVAVDLRVERRPAASRPHVVAPAAPGGVSGARQAPPTSSAYRSRSSRRRSLPDGPFGISSRKWTSAGTLKSARCARQWAIRSSADGGGAVARDDEAHDPLPVLGIGRPDRRRIPDGRRGGTGPRRSRGA